MKKIMLIGCGKTKRKEKCAARDMYLGDVFQQRLELSKYLADVAFVLSAKFGIVSLDRVIEPYEKTWPRVKTVSLEKAAWCSGVASQLLDELDDDDAPGTCHVSIHAGAAYTQPLASVLHCLGFRVSTPMEGMGIGTQKQQYGVMIERCKSVEFAWS